MWLVSIHALSQMGVTPLQSDVTFYLMVSLLGRVHPLTPIAMPLIVFSFHSLLFIPKDPSSNLYKKRNCAPNWQAEGKGQVTIIAFGFSAANLFSDGPTYHALPFFCTVSLCGGVHLGIGVVITKYMAQSLVYWCVKFP